MLIEVLAIFFGELPVLVGLPQPGADAALLTDLTRRAGQFAQALKVTNHALPTTEDDVIRTVLLFQKGLIASSDVAAHTIKEALGGAS